MVPLCDVLKAREVSAVRRGDFLSHSTGSRREGIALRRLPIRRVGLGVMSSPRKRYVSRLAVLLTLVLGLMGTMFLATVRESAAIPSFARKFNANCAMCHYPAVPRLNSFGQQYRRAGYRTPAEFNTYQDMTKVNELFAGRMRTQFAYEDKEGQNAIQRSEFKFPELAFYYSGAISRNFSTWVHATSSNSTNLDFHGHIQGVFGKPEHFLSVRVGQMHLLQQQGLGGFDSPTGLSTNPVNNVALTRTGTPVTFTLDGRQKGIELAYVRDRGRLLLQITNGLDEGGSGTAPKGDIDPDKDYLVAYEHILDDIASGFTVFYYHGTTHKTKTRLDNEFNFWRTGVNASKIVTVPDLGFLELQGGYTRSHDNNPTGTAAGLSIDGNAFYVESQQYITGPEVTFYERFSLIDLDLALKNSTRKDYTFGFVTPVQTWLRVAAEYTFTDNRDAGSTDHLATLEFQINY